MADDDVCVVLSNAPADAAQRIAEAVVDASLAACVNVIGPVVSVYRWEGTRVTDTEHTLVMKTVRARVDALTAMVVSLHPYTLPEVVVVPVVEGAGHEPYLQWVRGEVK